MCPPIDCPNCGNRTYHKGSCEHGPCGFAPLNATLEALQVDLTTLETDHPGLWHIGRQKPFPVYRICHPDWAIIDAVKVELGYSGPTFHHEPADPLDQEFYGIDLVKDFAVRVAA